MSPENKQDLLCFQHCGNKNIFCFQVPNHCPLCQSDLNCTDLRIPPFRVPNPFVKKKPGPFSFVLKPTSGCFFNTYAKGDALHIGITNSLAKIYAFDEGGVRCFQEWPNCLAIRLVSPTTHELEDLDQVLDASKVSVTWAAARYDEHNHNCFDFIVAMLNEFEFHSPSSLPWNKNTLTETHICPAIKKAAQFISAYRTVSTNGWLSHSKDDT